MGNALCSRYSSALVPLSGDLVGPDSAARAHQPGRDVFKADMDSVVVSVIVSA